jgi:RimJ/RimL family protein N-acetyltransferase
VGHRITTERLVLETLTADEAAAIRSGDRTGRCWALDYPTDGDALVAAVIGEAGDAYDEEADIGVLQVRRAATGEAIGGVGFLSGADEDGIAEIGYGFAESVRGQGLATEAVAAVLGWVAGSGVAAVEALTEPANTASHRVLERCGFQRAGERVTDDGTMLRWLRLMPGGASGQ